jgi:peptide-methionine (S)-S-oxide reductase
MQGGPAVSIETATFGAGCFWGVEAKFAEIPGVLETAVGYEGGSLDHPTYKDVCTDRTGHAEVVQVQFDPARVSYEALLDQFFQLHDPTQMNRQGPDYGSQYRSVIYYHSKAQQVTAQRKLEELKVAGIFPKPIVTELSPAQNFWRGEEYHQKYLEKRGMAHCHI